MADASDSQSVYVQGSPTSSYISRVLNTSPSNLILYRPLAEGYGTVSYDQNDPDRNGTYSRDVSTMGTITGIGDGLTAPDFDGANDSVTIYSSEFASLFDGAEGTAIVWFKFESGAWTDFLNRYLWRIYATSNNYIYFRKSNSANSMLARLRSGGTILDISFAYSATTWTCVVLRWSESSDTFDVWLNGVQEDSVGSLGTFSGSPTTSSALGAVDTSPQQITDGGVAHFAVWDTPLSDTEIRKLSTVYETSWQPAYVYATAPGTQTSDTQSAFTQGITSTTDSQPAYMEGFLPGASDSQPAYITGTDTTSDSQSAFIRGSGTGSDQISFLSNQLAMAIARNSNSRVFLIDNGARPDRIPEYQSHVVSGPLEQSFGDIVSIEYPDPDRYGAFISKTEIRGVVERPTIELNGLYVIEVATSVAKKNRALCPVDVHIHFGSCQNPSDFSNFDKAIVLENAFLINFSADDMGALESSAVGVINYSAEFSADDFFELLPIKFRDITPPEASGEIVDIIMPDAQNCDDCQEDNTGCDIVYALMDGTSLVYSPNAGKNWYYYTISGMGSDTPTALEIIAGNIVVFNGTTAEHHYAKSSNLSTWTEVSNGYIASGQPNDAWSIGNMAFVVGNNGYIYSCSQPQDGVTVLDAGVASSQALLAVHAASEQLALAGGQAGAIVFTTNGTSWQASPTTPTANNINTVWMKDKRTWWIGTSGGKLYYTVNSGLSWTEKTFYLSGSGSVENILFPNNNVMYVSHTLSGQSRLLRSYDGGNSLVVLPDDIGDLPASSRINAIASCRTDPNFCLGVGLSSDGVSGHMVSTPSMTTKAVIETVTLPPDPRTELLGAGDHIAAWREDISTDEVYYLGTHVGNNLFFGLGFRESTDGQGFTMHRIKTGRIVWGGNAVNNDSGDISYTGTTNSGTGSTWFQGTYTYLNDTGERLDYTTPSGTTDIWLLNPSVSNGGLGRVKIDGDATAATDLPTAQDIVDAGLAPNTILVANGGNLNPTDRVMNFYDPLGPVATRVVHDLSPAAYELTVEWVGEKVTASSDDRVYCSGIGYWGPSMATSNAAFSVYSRNSYLEMFTTGSEFHYALNARPNPLDSQTFIGGGHSYDEETAFTLYVDSTPTTLSDLEATGGSDIYISRESDLTHPDVAPTKLADITCTFEAHATYGIVVTNRFDWVFSMTDVDGYDAMFPVVIGFDKGNFVYQNTYKGSDYDLSIDDDTYYPSISGGVAQAIYAWQISGDGDMACMISYPDNVLNLMLWDRAAYNKMYAHHGFIPNPPTNGTTWGPRTFHYRGGYFDDADAVLSESS